MNDKFPYFITACITIVVLVFIAALWDDCDTTKKNRVECMKEHSAADCKLLFPMDNGR